jgi:hypothetical protein
MKRKSRRAEKPVPVYERIREILESARVIVSRSVNSTQVVANWLIGREIFEEEQRGEKRADYGTRMLARLSCRLQATYGKGFSLNNLSTSRRDNRKPISEEAPRSHTVR